MNSIFNLNHPIIAAVRDVKHFDRALDSLVEVIFLMGGNLCQVKELVSKAKQHEKMIFLHVDLLKGIGRDREAIEYLSIKITPTGIVSTKPFLIQTAMKQGLSTVLQVFMIDSQAFDTGLKNTQNLAPDAIEIMPGLMPRVIEQLSQHTQLPLLTAGLIKEQEEVDMMLHAGCTGIAVSEMSLWNYSPDMGRYRKPGTIDIVHSELAF